MSLVQIFVRVIDLEIDCCNSLASSGTALLLRPFGGQDCVDQSPSPCPRRIAFIRFSPTKDNLPLSCDVMYSTAGIHEAVDGSEL